MKISYATGLNLSSWSVILMKSSWVFWHFNFRDVSIRIASINIKLKVIVKSGIQCTRVDSYFELKTVKHFSNFPGKLWKILWCVTARLYRNIRVKGFICSLKCRKDFFFSKQNKKTSNLLYKLFLIFMANKFPRKSEESSENIFLRFPINFLIFVAHSSKISLFKSDPLEWFQFRENLSFK